MKRCRRRYPTVQLSDDIYQARVEEILSAPLPRDPLKTIHCEDLFLAIACSKGDRIAWEHFADDYLPMLRQFALRACGNSSEAEDLAQEVTAKLLNEKNRLAGYNGRGSLAGWLRVTVAHAAIDRFRRTMRESSLDALQESGAAVLQDDRHDEREDTLDSRWGRIIEEIADDCLRRFPPRDRLLLSLYYLQGVPLKSIAARYGVHEATAYRWIDTVRRQIRKQVERDLRKRHRLNPEEIQSLWRWVSPSSLAESVGGRDAPGSGGEPEKKPAKREDPGVIRKGGLQ